MKRLVYFFDKVEDRVRGKLSHYPILYAIIGGIGIILFWRGVWVTADYAFSSVITFPIGTMGSTINPIGVTWWDGPLSFLMGFVILLVTGTFVSNFIGNEVIITGLRGDKKISEKTEREMRIEVGAIGEIRDEVKKVLERLDAWRDGKQ